MLPETPVFMRDFPDNVVQLVQRNRGAGQCVTTPGAAKEGLVPMQGNPTPVCLMCKRALPRDHFAPQIYRGKPHGIHRRCKECQREFARIPIDNGDGTFSIPLTRGKLALIDACDLELVTRYRWRVHGQRTLYAVSGNGRNGNGPFYMHRIVLGLGPEDLRDGDHINCNGLDNRQCNLRAVSRAENTRRAKHVHANKSSQYRGVRWHKGTAKWCAVITVNLVRKSLGYFHDELEAAMAYDQAAREFHGEFACLNFPVMEPGVARKEAQAA